MPNATDKHNKTHQTHFRIRRRLALAAAAYAVVLGACGTSAPAAGEILVPPPPLSLVAVLGGAANQAGVELEQLAQVVQAAATPGEALVVSLARTAPLQGIYVVRGGDSLASIAAAHGIALSALEAANPQLGPVANRDWNRIYPDDRVTLPGARAGAPAGDLLVTRAPAGPPLPRLARLPQRPSPATTFQEAEYRRLLAVARSTNQQRTEAWLAQAARRVAPWQSQVIAELRNIAAAGLSDSAGRPDLAASIQMAATTLHGLPGRRVLLLLGGGQGGSAEDALRSASLAGVTLVVANLLDPVVAAAWTRAGTAAGASVATLDPALSQLQLSSVVNG